MDQLQHDNFRVRSFDLTYMNEYGEGIIEISGAHSRGMRFSLTLDDGTFLMDSTEDGSKIDQYLKLRGIITHQRIAKYHRPFKNFNVYYSTPRANWATIEKHLTIVIDQKMLNAEEIRNYLVKGKKYNKIHVIIPRDTLLSRINPNAIAFVASFAKGYFELTSRIYDQPLIFNGAMFEHCKAEKIFLSDISLDKVGCSSINVDTLRLTSLHGEIPNPYLSYCKCKHLAIAGINCINFPPFPEMLESLEIVNSSVDILTVAYLPYLQKLIIDKADTVILYELLDLIDFNIKTEKLYIQEDIAKGISTLTYDKADDNFATGLLEAMPNIQNYRTIIYTEADAELTPQLKSLETYSMTAPIDKLPEHLERFIPRNLGYINIPSILRERPNIKETGWDYSLDANTINDEFPNVVFLSDNTGYRPLNDEIKAHNRRARNRTMTLESLAE